MLHCEGRECSLRVETTLVTVSPVGVVVPPEWWFLEQRPTELSLRTATTQQVGAEYSSDLPKIEIKIEIENKLLETVTMDNDWAVWSHRKCWRDSELGKRWFQLDNTVEHAVLPQLVRLQGWMRGHLVRKHQAVSITQFLPVRTVNQFKRRCAVLGPSWIQLGQCLRQWSSVVQLLKAQRRLLVLRLDIPVDIIRQICECKSQRTVRTEDQFKFEMVYCPVWDREMPKMIAIDDGLHAEEHKMTGEQVFLPQLVRLQSWMRGYLARKHRAVSTIQFLAQRWNDEGRPDLDGVRYCHSNEYVLVKANMQFPDIPYDTWDYVTQFVSAVPEVVANWQAAVSVLQLRMSTKAYTDTVRRGGWILLKLQAVRMRLAVATAVLSPLSAVHRCEWVQGQEGQGMVPLFWSSRLVTSATVQRNRLLRLGFSKKVSKSLARIPKIPYPSIRALMHAQLATTMPPERQHALARAKSIDRRIGMLHAERRRVLRDPPVQPQ